MERPSSSPHAADASRPAPRPAPRPAARGGRRPDRRGLAAALLAASVLAASAGAGCGSYHAIVRTEGAPFYAGPDRSVVLGRMDKLEAVTIGISLPEEDPLPIAFGGRRGYADQDDLWVFHREDGERLDVLVEAHRREVVLAEKPWPARTKMAIRARRLEPGMSREMVTLAWGLPRSVERADDGGETWTFEEVLWDVRDVHYRGVSPDIRIGFTMGGAWGRCGPGWGAWGWGAGFGVPIYTDRIHRTYTPRPVRRTVRFEEGVVRSWDAGQDADGESAP